MSHLCRLLLLHCTDRMDEMGKHKSSFHSQEKTINCRQKVQRKRIEFLLREQNLFIVKLQVLPFENLTLNFELLSSDLDLDHGLDTGP